MPERVQLQRLQGWTLPSGAKSVARPSPFGNPFTLAGAIEIGFAASPEEARKVSVAFHRSWLLGEDPGVNDRYKTGSRWYDRRWVLANLHLIRGRSLACWCPLPEPGQPDICHAAVLIELANKEIR